MADTPTTAQEIYDSFEASFQDKCVIPEELEKIWLLKAIGRYSIELTPLIFDEDTNEFDCKLKTTSNTFSSSSVAFSILFKCSSSI